MKSFFSNSFDEKVLSVFAFAFAFAFALALASFASSFSPPITTAGWRILGSRDKDAGPNNDESTGTGRHPSTCNPCDRAIDSKVAFDRSKTSGSFLKNKFPTAYCPAAGSSTPQRYLNSRRMNLSGIEVITPAPSPSRASEPTAPRCVMLQRRYLASEMIRCDASPFIWHAKPTPQLSFSYSGWYKPFCTGRVEAHDLFSSTSSYL